MDEDRGEQAVESGNREPIGICGSDWAAIQKPSSGGIHPGQGKDRREGGSIFETRKKGIEGEKNPHATIPSTPLSPRGGFRTGGPIGGRTFLQRSLTKRP